MRYFWFIFGILLFVVSCVTREGNIENFDNGKVVVEYNNTDTLSKRSVNLFLSTDREYNPKKIEVELKITTPQKRFFRDTVVFLNNPSIKKVSGLSENIVTIYNRAVFRNKGKYFFEIKSRNIESKFLFKGGVIIK